MKKINTCNDNIFALSTPVGGAIAVIRASGSGVLPVLREIFSGRIEHRQLNYGKITDRIEPDGGQGEERKENEAGALAVLDEAMAVYFRAPHSYTGEDMFELNLHGSYSVVSAVSRALTRRGMRLAEAGEFTKRAFLNGKMDLVQADAVMDLINAETRRGASAALEQLEGGLSSRIGAIEEKLLDFASELAAAMDYPEEMEDEVLSAAPEVLNSAISRIRDLIDNGNCNKIIREGAKLAILGRPNVGKSSLLNALMNAERAIVTNIAGTTRDVLEEKIDLLGLPVRIADTAGIHETGDAVEKIGIERALHEAASAECVLLLFDGSAGITQEDERLVQKVFGMNCRNIIFVINKCDLSDCGTAAEQLKNIAPENGGSISRISCRTGFGLDELKHRIAEAVGLSEGRAIVTNERHIECLSAACAELCEAAELFSKGGNAAEMLLPQTELVAESVGNALHCLGEISGREVSEELLDRIFERFCVGK